MHSRCKFRAAVAGNTTETRVLLQPLMRIATTFPYHTLTLYPHNHPKAMRSATLIFLVSAVFAACQVASPTQGTSSPFSGSEAYALVVEQLEFGPRIPGTPGSMAAGDWILQKAAARGWETEEQLFEYGATVLRNVIAKPSHGLGPPVILGAHYDTRPLADRDAVGTDLPVPGANDGASGVAVLLELARVLDPEELPFPVWLAFFDAEDSGGIDDWEWIVGSRYFASTLSLRPLAVVIVDMVGDADLQLYIERSSDPPMAASIWSVAEALGYAAFIPEPGRSILDDHMPFVQMGIPSVDIIDLDYPYWHTTADTADKVSPASLEQVGRVLEAWLYQLDGLTTHSP